MPRLVPKSLARLWRSLIPKVTSRPPPPTANIEYNRQLWDRYARNWDQRAFEVENKDVRPEDIDDYLQFVGDEWGRVEDVVALVRDWIHPHVNERSHVAEIGAGGGRVAAKVADRVARLWCFDISAEMQIRARSVLATSTNVEYVLVEGAELPAAMGDTFDFVYSFDVFVHLDVHTMWKYVREIHRVLKDGGRALLHTTNLTSPGGWNHFAAQDAYKVEGHYFVTPELVRVLAERGGFVIVKESTPDPTNFYLNRDYLVILEKRRHPSL